MATSNRGSSGSEPLALELLMSDHRKVERLFERYEEEKDGDEETKQQLCERICNELKIHAQVEEELFYPWVREQLDEGELVEEALVEHQSAKDLIAQIEGAGQMDESLDAKVKVLGEYIKHHVNEEENEMFPKLRGEQEALDELGQELASRKAELKEEMGIEEDEEDQEESEGAMIATGGGRRKSRGDTAQRGSR